MAFATIMDHVGIFESNRLKGGITVAGLCLFPISKGFCFSLSIYSNSYFDMCGCRSGVLDVADNQTKTHRNPDNPKITNGPKIPACDMRIGDNTSPIAFPDVNPPIAIATALARSV